MRFAFGDCRIDTERYELSRSGEVCAVEPKVFDLIVHLASHPDRVFTRDELIDVVWSGRVVSDSTVSTCIKHARRAIGDSGDAQRYIETVRGRGFRFVAEVVRESEPVEESATDAGGGPRVDGTSTPSLLLTAFRPLGHDEQSLRLVDGLHRDLASVLTRIPLLSLAVHDQAADMSTVGPGARKMHEHFGVDYVLEGTLRGHDDGVDINVQLVDARSGFQLWAERLQLAGTTDDVAERAMVSVVAKLEPQLHRAIYDAVRSRDGSANARELYLEASGMLALKGWHHESIARARCPLTSAIRTTRWSSRCPDVAPECRSACMSPSVVRTTTQRPAICCAPRLPRVWTRRSAWSPACSTSSSSICR